MAVVLKRAYSAQPILDYTTLYTCPPGTTTRVVKCIVVNDTTTPMTFRMYKVPMGAATNDEYLVYCDKPVGSKETFGCPDMVGQVLNENDYIVCFPSAVNQLSVHLDVAEIT